MQLTAYSDFSLRVLIYTAVHPGRYVSTQEISRAYGISLNHLIKVVHQLGKLGFLEIKRGRRGGIRLQGSPDQIRIGDVVRKTEPGFVIAECFEASTNRCPITPVCGLKQLLHDALKAFLEVLDQATLQSVLQRPQLYATLLGRGPLARKA
jgi:Rrf2 family transcriptional regulator, nitric oxide-sensitive transcriptional repressor